jgi:replicative DNA helicase
MSVNPLNILAQVPADLEAENAIIGACLTDKESIQKVCDVLNPEDFYDRKNQEAYSAMLSLEDKACPIDMITVNDVLKKKKIDIIGHLTDCVGMSLGSVGLRQHVKIVKEKRVLRELLETSNQLIENVKSGDGDADDMLDMVEQRILSISKKNGKKKYQKIGSIVGDVIDKIELLIEGKIEPGLMSGIKSLDDITGGFKNSDLIIIGARPSVGKSSLAMTIANNVAHQDKAVAFFSLEMSKEQLTWRVLAIESGINLWNIMNKRVSNQGELARLKEEAVKLEEIPLIIDDTFSPTVMEIRRACRRIKAENKNLALVVIDYLQLIKPSRDGKPNDQVSEISRNLKGLAKELDVPVIALSQLSRNVEMRDSTVPRLSDLRDSGALEQDSDVVIFIHRNYNFGDDKPSDLVELRVDKHRNGPVGIANAHFNKETTGFS